MNVDEIDDFSSEEDLISWGLGHFWEIVGQVDPDGRFSDQMLALQGLRSLRKAARRWGGEQLPFYAWWDLVLRDDLAKAAKDGRFRTSAEEAIAQIEAAESGDVR